MRRREFITLLGGAATAWPFGAAAQQPGKVYRIGILNAGTGVSPELRSALPEALRGLGWVEGKNVVFERRYAENRLDLLPELAAELVRLNVDVIAAGGTLAPIAAKRATATIPIVMTAAGDPLGSGLVASLARPGGNITGLSLMAADLGGSTWNCSMNFFHGPHAWPFSGMPPIRIPRMSSKRRRARPERWGSRFDPWRCKAPVSSIAHLNLRDESA
jgi:ABC transporter substrate binding protein